jgi:hypothetical protein
MTIDRRAFVVGTAVVAVSPALHLFPVEAASAASAVNSTVFMIEGWSIPDEGRAANQVWLRVGRSWRTEWR